MKVRKLATFHRISWRKIAITLIDLESLSTDFGRQHYSGLGADIVMESISLIDPRFLSVRGTDRCLTAALCGNKVATAE